MGKLDAYQCIGQSFEQRFFSSSPQANGETDFKGDSSILSTDDRIDFLNRYAQTSSDFFSDPGLNQPAVSRSDLTRALAKLKPQPRPEIRKRIPLKTWSRQALPAVEKRQQKAKLTPPGVEWGEDCLEWYRHSGYKVPFPSQNWRAFFWITLALPEATSATIIRLGEAAKIVLCDNWQLVVNGKRGGRRLQPHIPLEIKIELDLVSDDGRCNVFVNDVMMVGWQPVRSTEPCGFLTISGVSGLRMFSCQGLGFEPAPPPPEETTASQPYVFVPLFNRNFQPQTETEGWEKYDFDDSTWHSSTTPCVHGGAMGAGEDLVLRKRTRIPSFRLATLYFESLDPGGEIWINGRLAHRQEGPHSFKIAAERWLKPSEYNLIAVRVYHRQDSRRINHTRADKETGWFLGRVSLDLHQDLFLEDLLVATEEVENPAVLNWQVRFRNELGGSDMPESATPFYFEGRVRLEISRWYPEEDFIAAIDSASVRGSYKQPVIVRGKINIPDPRLWSVEDPQLYRVRAVLLDDRGYELDDLVITTGLRTVSQEGGVFRLNQKPTMMNGGENSGTRPPIEEQAKYLRCGRQEDLVHDILTVHNLGGNTVRMKVHDGPAGGVNDPRLAEIGDQLGILFQWSTNEWVHSSSPWQLALDRLAHDIRQVRNHPSIVMWQTGNHPVFESWQNEGKEWFQQVVDAILAVDNSRLIAPTANLDNLFAPSDDGTVDRNLQSIPPLPAWTHPLVVRGNLEKTTGYGNEWSLLRKWPRPRQDEDKEQELEPNDFREEYLNSREHAYFDFESEGSAAQPNWSLLRGQPYYRLRSYEADYDKGSIGRCLQLREWRASQAWQAFSAYEAYRKKRLLGYDGLTWCTLDGGGNSGTCEKPLTDALGHKKLAFHTLRMVFQPTLGGSRDVNLVYGPDDSICPSIMHSGPARKVDLHIQINCRDGTLMAENVYPDIQLPQGRCRIDLDPWPRPPLKDGIYVIYYRVLQT